MKLSTDLIYYLTNKPTSQDSGHCGQCSNTTIDNTAHRIWNDQLLLFQLYLRRKYETVVSIVGTLVWLTPINYVGGACCESYISQIEQRSGGTRASNCRSWPRTVPATLEEPFELSSLN